MVAQHSPKEGEEPQTGLSVGRPLLSGVCVIRCDVSNPEKSKNEVIHADHLKPYLGPALKSWIVEREGTVMPAESQVVRAGEVGPVSGPVEAVLSEGMSDGNDAMESLNPVLCSSPEADDPEPDEESCGSDTDTAILPQTQTATPDDRPSSETESFDAASCGHLSQAVQSRYGRQRRPPNCYGDWV